MTTRHARGHARTAALLSGAAMALVLTAVPAHADAPVAGQSQAQERPFNIGASAFDVALNRFSEQSGIQLVYDAELVQGRRAPAVRGRMTPERALAALLAGQGLTSRFLNANTITIEREAGAGIEADGSRVLGAVRVEGAQSPYNGGAGQAAGVNGVNGSNDITATEGTGSFTSGALTIGSKMPQALKDVPQSISVLTSEQMEQQAITDFDDALRQMPGITLVQGSNSLENTFYSRGFAITSIQVDGGAPLTTAGYGFFPQIDMSIYDHVELLRGAAGQFGSYGDPGGTVNLVRKRPLDHAQFTLETQVGSWQNYRVVADATSPLALDGDLRGRLVMTYQDRHYFYDTAKDNKTLIYGIVELDATPTTLVTAGASYTRQDSVPWYGGLPRYWNGEDLELPRSTCLCFDWNRWDFDTTEIFGGVEQKLGGEWTAKLNLTWNRQQSTRKVGYSQGAVSPLTGAGPQLSASYGDAASDQFSAEAVLSGAFELFGQRQEVTIGANRVSSDSGGSTSYASPISSSSSAPYQPYPGGPLYCTDVSVCPSGVASPPINVFDFDPADPNYTEPRDPLASGYYPTYGQVQAGAYMNLRLTAFDRLHLITGLRWSRYEYGYTFAQLCTETTSSSCAGKQIGDVSNTGGASYSDDDISWPPSVNLSFDVTKQLTAYAGYTDIYQSQANYLDANHNPLEPVTGSNWEAGLKWAARDGRLNLSFAAYSIEQKGFAASDGNPTEEISPDVYCCLVIDPDRTLKSEGADIEATGEIIPGWQVAASYTFNQTEYEGSVYGSNLGKPFTSIQPEHLYKLWMSYDFGRAGHGGALSHLTLSGGVNGQSSAYYSGQVCPTEYYAPYPQYPFYQVCTVDEEPYLFTVPAYAVVSARIDYRFSDRWSLAVNLENILDKTYYQTVGGAPTGGNWYGAPRSFNATLRARF